MLSLASKLGPSAHARKCESGLQDVSLRSKYRGDSGKPTVVSRVDARETTAHMPNLDAIDAKAANKREIR